MLNFLEIVTGISSDLLMRSGTEEHHAFAQKASEQSIVLLKNEGNILPLKNGAKVAVIGEFAKVARYQGAGSSAVNCTKLDHTLDVIGNFPLDVVGFEPGYPRHGAPDADKAATFTLTNTGDWDGAEVAQLYVHAKAPTVYRPAKGSSKMKKISLSTLMGESEIFFLH